MASISQESDRGETSTESSETPAEVEADVFRSRLEIHRGFLEERIDPDFGLLDRLRANKAITYREFQVIAAEKVSFRKNGMLLDSILHGTGTEKISKFRDALKETKQEHIVNYVNGDGEYKPQFGGEWPLSETQVSILEDNIDYFIEHIDTAQGLLTCMIGKKAITKRQADSISAHAEPCKGSEALLDFLRRGSQSNYEKTTEALNATNQKHVADVMIFGGVVLQVHSRADANLPAINQAEEEIVSQLDAVLQDKTPEEARHLLETYLRLKNNGLINARVKKSIVFYFHCKNLEQFLLLLELLVKEEFKKIIETIYNRVLATSTKVGVKVTWDGAKFDEAKSKLQGDVTQPVESEVPTTSVQDVAEAEVGSTFEDREKPAVAGLAKVEEEPITSDEDINAAILRNNSDFFNQHIRPKGVIDKLHALDILSDEDTRYMKTLKHNNEKNDEMLNVIRNRSTEDYNTFVSFLREDGQTIVAEVAEKGGVILKAKITHEPTDDLESIEKEIVEKLNQLQDKTVTKSDEVWRFLSQLKRANIEIVSSRWDKGIVLWLWCRSSSALKKLDDLNMPETKKLNQLLKDLFSLFLAGKNTPTISNVYLENPEKEVVCRRPTSIHGEKRFTVGERQAFGVTKLRTKICLLCQNPNAIVVYDEEDLTKPSEELPLSGIITPLDMTSSNESNCLYITDKGRDSVWKIAISSPENKVDIWLDSGAADPYTLSVTNDGRVVMVKRGSPSCLEIYSPDARTLLHLVLPSPILRPNHAVETSKGNFIVSHDKDDEFVGGVCEITKEGQFISRIDGMFELIRGVTENVNKLLAEITEAKFFCFKYLAIDDKDQVYACDGQGGELVVLDSRLALLEESKSGLNAALRVQYFKEQMQLVVIHGLQQNLISVLYRK